MKKLSPCLIFFAALLGMASQASADVACEQSCNLTHEQCTQECGSGGTYWCFEACDQQRDTCWNNCQLCPSSRDYTTSTILSRTYTNRNGCYQDHLYLNGGRRYYEYLTKERRNNYRETTQCDGSKSTQLLSSSTYNYYCWVRGNTGADACSYPALNNLFLCH